MFDSESENESESESESETVAQPLLGPFEIVVILRCNGGIFLRFGFGSVEETCCEFLKGMLSVDNHLKLWHFGDERSISERYILVDIICFVVTTARSMELMFIISEEQ